MSLPIQRDALDAIAASLDYPHDGSVAAARAAAEALTPTDDNAAEAFASLARWLEAVPRDTAEETYTTLFDLRPACTLHVGYHVYGEAYQRGALLAGLVRELKRVGVDQGTELSDYLPTVLRLIGRLPYDEDVQLFVDRILSVALARMQRELATTQTPWAHAVASLGAVFGTPAHLPVDDSLQALIQRETTSHA